MSDIAPYHLPQINMPANIAVERLSEMGLEPELIEMDPNELNPMQAFVLSDGVSNIKPEELKPIWISDNNDVIDGHHAMMCALINNVPIKCFRINLDANGCIRVLNKIQDIYEYNQQLGLEEVVLQNVINDNNENNFDVEYDDVLGELDNKEISSDGNECKVIAYREKPIKEESIIGNFFLLKPQKGFDKYEIDFENLLDTNDIGVNVTGTNPIDVLAKTWFPNIDFEKENAPFKYTPEQLKNKAIAEKAKKMGYDGIKYGDLMVQGLK